MDNYLCALYEPFIIIIDSNKRVWPYRHITVNSWFIFYVLSVHKTVLQIICLCVPYYLPCCMSKAMKQSYKLGKDISN